MLCSHHLREPEFDIEWLFENQKSACHASSAGLILNPAPEIGVQSKAGGEKPPASEIAWAVNPL